jgi:hypothetical protein
VKAFLKSRKFMGGAALAAVLAFGGMAVSAQQDGSSAGFGRGGGLMVARALAGATADAAGITTLELVRQLQADETSLLGFIEANGLNVNEITAALEARYTDQIAQALANGRINEDQAATLTESFDAAVQEALSATFPLPGNGNQGARLTDQLLVSVLMENTGLTARELAAAAQGLTLQEYADSIGLNLDSVFAEVISRAQAFLTQRQAAGEITAEESAAVLEELNATLAELPSQTLREHAAGRLRDRFGGPGGGPFGGRGGQGGFGIGAPAAGGAGI